MENAARQEAKTSRESKSPTTTSAHDSAEKVFFKILSARRADAAFRASASPSGLEDSGCLPKNARRRPADAAVSGSSRLSRAAATAARRSASKVSGRILKSKAAPESSPSAPGRSSGRASAHREADESENSL